MKAVGIDIGTTNIGLVAVALDTAQVVERLSSPNRRIPSQDGFSYLQDPKTIAATAEELLSRLPMSASSIGVNGQVHGILYLDKRGKVLSPLYTWLDRRGTEQINGEVPRERLLARCGRILPNGYGLLTHYANRIMDLVPDGAARITGICEYVTERILGGPLDKTDESCLAPFGGWDHLSGKHDPVLLAEILPAGSPAFLAAAEPLSSAGRNSAGIPVAYPVGDNQASFFALVIDPETACLVSIGTSGQLTLFSRSSRRIPSMELRPYFGLGSLQVNATLCAGKAYEVLERFCQSILTRGDIKDADETFVYSLMEAAAREPGCGEALRVETSFNGNRADPSIRGSITGIGLDNLSLGSLVRGTIDGIVRELKDCRVDLGEEFRSISTRIATGNAVRKNPLLVESLQRQFGLDTMAPDIDNAAAVGSALVGAVAAGTITLEERVPLLKRLLWKSG